MQKIYQSLTMIMFAAACSNAVAQAPTITSTAIPQVGYTYNMMTDTAYGDVATFTVSAGSASSQTWNYSSVWAATDSAYADPTAFVAPSSGTGSSNFPGANMALNQNGNWVYLITGSPGLLVDGVYATIQGSPAVLDFTPNPAQIPVPFTYTSTPVTNDYTATFTVTVSGFTANVKHRAHRVITADAFGSLTTPSGTYASTLRLKTYEITSDSASVFGTFVGAQYDTTTNYSWLQNTTNSLLMSVDLTHTGATKKVQYLQSLSFGVASVSQPSASFNASPNPASEMTWLTYENKSTGPVSLTLSDVTGKQMAVLLNEQQGTGIQKVAVNTAALHLPAGMYFLQLNSNNNLKTIKLVID